VDFNTAVAEQGVSPSPTRIWLLDLTAVPVTTRPLMSDLQTVGHSPQWSDDGQTIAFYSTNLSAIVVYNVETGQLISVPSGGGTSGALSPDATRLAYPDIVVNEGTGVNSVLKLAALSAGEETMLTPPDAQIDDSRALWRPDGEALAVARRDPASVRGYQVVELDPATGEARLLTDDPRYSNMFFWWDATGQQLVLQRFPELDANMQPNMEGRPEIWTLDTATGKMTLLVEDGMLPRWVP
jgi:Tol biopolymer transport system component